MAQVGGSPISPSKNRNQYYWPACVNAAMALSTRRFFESTSPANLIIIDSLEKAYKVNFASEADAEKITNAEEYGQIVASSIFEWSKTDGGHDAYKHFVDPNYLAPVGAGLWIPTPPALAAPIRPHWGENRSFMLNSALLTQPEPPVA